MSDLPKEKGFPRTLAEMLDCPENLDGIRRLTEQLDTPRRVIPFVGAGISAGYDFPGWWDFLVGVAGNTHKTHVETLLSNNQYEAAASYLHERKRAAFHRAIEDTFGAHKSEHLTPIGASLYLHRLTTGPILTTNFDRVIEHCYKRITGQDIPVTWGAKESALQKLLSTGRRMLYKLHGDAEEKSDRILTAEEYNQHYGDSPDLGYDPDFRLPKALAKLMDNTPLLFLGCSLKQDRTLMVLNTLAKNDDHPGHFALVEAPLTEADFEVRRDHFDVHNIIPIWFGPGEFHLIEKFLEHLCKGIADPATQKTAQPAPATTHYLLEGKKSFYGRDDKLKELEDWLTSTKVVCNVHGAPGIGKSRLCHRFLELWKNEDPTRLLHYIDLTAVNNAGAFLEKLMKGFQIPETVINAMVGTLEKADKSAIQAHMQMVAGYVDEAGGIVYFDNLEDPLQDPQTTQLLQPLAQLRQTRLLCSSRIVLSTRIAHNIKVEGLDDQAALDLFAEHWKWSGAVEREWDAEGRDFVRSELDNHALSIELVAAQAQNHSAMMSRLIAAWKKKGPSLAHSGDQNPDKRDSLEASLDLSFDALARLPQSPIHFWALAALFPEGMSERAQADLAGVHWAELTPPRVLIRYNVLKCDQEGRLRMLAPIRAYMLARLREGTGGLNWQATLKSMYERFLQPIAKAAKEAVLGKDPEKGAKYDALLDEFPALVSWLEEANTKGDNWKEKFAEVLGFTWNFLAHRPIASTTLLGTMIQVFGRNKMDLFHANALHRLGNMLDMMGNLPKAQKNYLEAHAFYQKLEYYSGLATSLLCIGSLDRRGGNPSEARAKYFEAAEYFDTLHDEIGFAWCLLHIGDLELDLSLPQIAKPLYREAFNIFSRENYSGGVANALLSMGQLEHFVGNSIEAYALIEDAIANFHKDRDQLGLANALQSLGSIESMLGKTDIAKERFHEASKKYIAAGNKLGIANSYLSLADTLKQCDKDQSLPLYLESKSLYKELGDKIGLANVNKNLGVLYFENGDFETAIRCFSEAGQLYEKGQSFAGEAQVLALLALTFNTIGQIVERNEFYEYAINKAHLSQSSKLVDSIILMGANWNA